MFELFRWSIRGKAVGWLLHVWMKQMPDEVFLQSCCLRAVHTTVETGKSFPPSAANLVSEWVSELLPTRARSISEEQLLPECSRNATSPHSNFFGGDLNQEPSHPFANNISNCSDVPPTDTKNHRNSPKHMAGGDEGDRLLWPPHVCLFLSWDVLFTFLPTDPAASALLGVSWAKFLQLPKLR